MSYDEAFTINNVPVQGDYLHGLNDPACDRVDICKTIPQRRPSTLEVIDRAHYLRKAPLDVSVQLGTGDTALFSPLLQGSEPGQYLLPSTFLLETNGIQIVNVFVNGEHIEQSPFFVEVVPRKCAGSHEEPNNVGVCVCESGFERSGDQCVSSAIKALQIALPVAFALLLLVVLLFIRQRRQADRAWLVPMKDLVFKGGADAEPIGEGSFGRVYKASLRGTDVAAKKILWNGATGRSVANRTVGPNGRSKAGGTFGSFGGSRSRTGKSGQSSMGSKRYVVGLRGRGQAGLVELKATSHPPRASPPSIPIQLELLQGDAAAGEDPPPLHRDVHGRRH